MRAYQASPANNEKEKAVGGIMTFTQLGWILAGVVIGFILFYMFYGIMGFVSIIFAIPFIAIGCVFAFKKKGDLTLFEYIRLKREHKGKTKKLFNNKTISNEIFFDVYNEH